MSGTFDGSIEPLHWRRILSQRFQICLWIEMDPENSLRISTLEQSQSQNDV
jgi:hypothetical protein